MFVTALNLVHTETQRTQILHRDPGPETLSHVLRFDFLRIDKVIRPLQPRWDTLPCFRLAQDC